MARSELLYSFPPLPWQRVRNLIYLLLARLLLRHFWCFWQELFVASPANQLIFMLQAMSQKKLLSRPLMSFGCCGLFVKTYSAV